MTTVHINLAGVTHTLTGDLTRNDAQDLENLPGLVVRVGDVEKVHDPVRKRYTVRMVAEGVRPLVLAEGLSKGQAEQLECALEELFQAQENGVNVETE